MSAALASAKRRRGAPQTPTNTPVPGQSPQPTSPPVRQPMNIQQAFSIIDARISILEKTVKSLSEGGLQPQRGISGAIDDQLTKIVGDLEIMKVSGTNSDIVKELDEDLTAVMQEVDNLKNIVLSLQAYTMDVNRMLIDERNAKAKVEPAEKEAEVVDQSDSGEIEVLLNA